MVGQLTLSLFIKSRLTSANSFLLTILILASANSLAIEFEPWDLQQTGRIVAFGDVHGAYTELVELLLQADVIDSDSNWAGGTTQLVSLGDLFDRGSNSRQVAELMMRLQEQAPSQGGSVHIVLGNHELMLATGDLRYVSTDEYQSYASQESSQDRDNLFQRYEAHRATQGLNANRADFDASFPPGFAPLLADHGLDSEMGQWLLAQPLMLKIGDTLFTHGGLSEQLDNHTLQSVNVDLKQDIIEYLNQVKILTEQGILSPAIDYFDRESSLNRQLASYKEENGRRSEPSWAESAAQLSDLQASLIFDDNGPLWYRGTASCHPYIESYDVERVLSKWNARRVIVGHTPTPNRRITSKMNDMVILADTGMLNSYYQGRASAVIIEEQESDLWAMYAGEPGLQLPLQAELSVPRLPSGFDDASLEHFLLNAEIIDSVPIGTGITRPLRLTLSLDGVTLMAAYKNVDSHPNLETLSRYRRNTHDQSDRYHYEIAAYKLDRLIGLHLIPVSVERQVNGELGVVTLWLENTINERDRVNDEVPFTGFCDRFHQYRLRFLFDVLIFNEDRNLTNILWTDDDFRLLFIDHSRAFRSSTRRPDQYRRVTLELSNLFRVQLAALTEEILTEQLGQYLHPRQIEAILDRRDRIFNEAESTDF